MKAVIEKSKISGKITAEISKSYAQRVMVCDFLSGNLRDFYGDAEDIICTLNALRNFDKGKIEIKESGFTLRVILPLAVAFNIKCEIKLGERLKDRPIEQLITILNANGGKIKKIDDKIFTDGKLQSGKFIIDGSISSQFITGLIFSLSVIEGDSIISVENQLVSKDYVNLTLDVLNKYGVKVVSEGNAYKVFGKSKYIRPEKLKLEGDYSGASMLLSLGAITGKIKVKNLNRNSFQGDKIIIETIKEFGGKVRVKNNAITVRRNKDGLKGITFNAKNYPDLTFSVALLGSVSRGQTVIENVSRLRQKESDRVKGIIDILNAFSVKAELVGDKIVITGSTPKGCVIESKDDHRLEMLAVCLGILADGKTEIQKAGSVKKSYPEFYEDLIKLGAKIERV